MNYPAEKGIIKFKDPKKQEYNLAEILDLINYNFGYNPIEKYQDKKNSKAYVSLTQLIRRHLEKKRLPSSTSHNSKYSKESVYRLLKEDIFIKLLKLSDDSKQKNKSDSIVELYRKNRRIAKKEFPDNLEKYVDTFGGINEVSEEKLDLKMRILLDYFEKHIVELDEDLIDLDVSCVIDLKTTPRDGLDDTEYLSLSRYYKNYEEYYTVRNKDDKSKKNKK